MGHSATGGNHDAASTRPLGWHPEPVDDVALLRGELDACRAEIARLRVELAEARPAFRLNAAEWDRERQA